MVSVIIGGDLCPIGRNQVLFEQGNAASLLNDLLPVFESADLSIVNLECPLIQDESPIDKCGPVLGAPTTCVNGMQAAGIDVLNLANNHIMDHGPRGLRTTISALEQHGLMHVGAGANLEEARRIPVHKVNGIRIGILALAEHEFATASRNSPGANPLDVYDAVRNMRARRDSLDAIIILVHGGSEHYPYPGPSLLAACRFLAEEGASAIVCQHSHCTGSQEVHAGIPIIYGQGNFLFDMPHSSPTWHEGCLVRLAIGQGGRCEAQLVPYLQSAALPGARRMTGAEESVWRTAFDKRSTRLSDPEALEAQWQAFCHDRMRFYLHLLHGRPSILRRIAGRLGLLHCLDGVEKQRGRLSIIRCESHHDALKTVLEVEAGRRRGRASHEDVTGDAR